MDARRLLQLDVQPSLPGKQVRAFYVTVCSGRRSLQQRKARTVRDLTAQHPKRHVNTDNLKAHMKTAKNPLKKIKTMAAWKAQTSARSVFLFRWRWLLLLLLLLFQARLM